MKVRSIGSPKLDKFDAYIVGYSLLFWRQAYEWPFSVSRTQVITDSRHTLESDLKSVLPGAAGTAAREALALLLGGRDAEAIEAIEKLLPVDWATGVSHDS